MNPTSNIHSSESDSSTASTSRRNRIARQLAAYSVAAGAGAVGASDATAGVLSIDLPANLPGAPIVINDQDLLNIDIDGDGNDDFRIENYLGFGWASMHGTNSLNVIDADGVTGYLGNYLAHMFGAGEIIDGSPAGSLGYTQFTELDNFIGTRGFVGLRFDIPGNSPHFAYLDVSADSSAQTVTVHGGAYASASGAPIKTIPEPTSLGLLAIGAAGVATWLRRRED